MTPNFAKIVRDQEYTVHANDRVVFRHIGSFGGEIFEQGRVRVDASTEWGPRVVVIKPDSNLYHQISLEMDQWELWKLNGKLVSENGSVRG